MMPVLALNNRIAHERNERSAHEPRVVGREALLQGSAPRRGVNPLVRKQFGDVHKGGADQPWMVGH